MTKGTAIAITEADVFGLNQMAKIVRGLAIDNARSKVASLNPTKQTDSTTGTVGTAITAIVVPPATHQTDGIATTAAPKAGFDTAMGKFSNCAASLADFLNYYLAELGLPLVDIASGQTITAALPALDKTLTGVATTGAVEPATGQAELRKQMANFSTLNLAANRIAAALGYLPMVDASGGVASDTNVLVDNAATGTAVNGSTAYTLGDTATDLALTTLANNYATLSYWINRLLDPDEGNTITDSSGGTANTSLPPEMEANVNPDVFTTAGTDCAPKAGFDAQLVIIENAHSELATKVNELIRFNNALASIGLLTDDTGVSGNGTIESMSVNLTATTGSTNCVDATTALARMTTIKNNNATLTGKINELSALYGMEPLTYNEGGTASADDTIENIAATAAGNDGSADATLADADVDAWLFINRNNISTMAARLNALDNVGSRQSLAVVASF